MALVAIYPNYYNSGNLLFHTKWMLFNNVTDTCSSSSDKWDQQTFWFYHSDTECNRNDGPVYQDNFLNFCNDIDHMEISDALKWDGTCDQQNANV